MPVLRIATCIMMIALLGGCKKETDRTVECEDFIAALVQMDKPTLKTQFEIFIIQANARTHTNENLTKLVNHITQSCDVEISATCFACIDVLPGMSEIQIKFMHAGQFITRTVDLSTEHDDDKMMFVSVHE